MKGVSTPGADRSVIVVRDGDGFELRVWNRFTGDGPIGVRLTRKSDLPDLPTKSNSYSTALDLQERWQQWLDENPLSTRKKGRKR
jgi:hypothetical protein